MSDPALLRKMLTALYLEVPSSIADSFKEHFGPLIDDGERLAWLEANHMRLEDVRGHVNNEGGTVRQAIDWLRKV